MAQTEENQKNQEAGKNVAHTVGKAASTSLGGPVGGAIYDAASKTPIGQNIEQQSGNKIANTPGVGKVARRANDLGLPKAADNAIGYLGGGANSTLNAKAANGTPPVSNPTRRGGLSKSSFVNRGYVPGETGSNLEEETEKAPNENAKAPKEATNDDGASVDNSSTSETPNDNGSTSPKGENKSDDEKKDSGASPDLNKTMKFIQKNPWILSVAGIASAVIFLLLVVVLLGGSVEASTDLSYNSACSTSDNTYNLLTFLASWEGNGAYCDTNNYKAEDLKDGAITIGKGVTNALLSSVTEYIDSNSWGNYFRSSSESSAYYMQAGDCIPIDIMDKLMVYGVEKKYSTSIDPLATQYGVTLTQFQKDALTSFNYNLGPEYTEALISAYATGGEDGLWQEMKKYMHATIENEYQEVPGLKKRRKGEFALFVTGDYSDGGLFYGRNIDNYDYYDSEAVLAKKASCIGEISGNLADGFAVPLSFDSGFYCSSPYGMRKHPITGDNKNHNGLDLSVAEGTPIYASKDGTVTKTRTDVLGTNYSIATGNMVSILHPDGMRTDYLHMLYGSVIVNVGDEVKQGQKIGEVGTTGMSTGNHLHFIIYNSSGKDTDPYPYLDLSALANPDACHK